MAETTITGGVPLIDRDQERAVLHAALEESRAGTGRMVLLGGEPGIGKTRLATVVADEAAARGIPVWWGRGWEDGSAPAFWPWNMALRRWMGDVGRDAVAAVAGDGAAELAGVFPCLLRPGSPTTGVHGASDGARFQLFDAVGRFLAAVARPSGLVVVLDDAHWADQPSLKLLEFLATDVAMMPILFVVTYRDTEVDGGHPFGATLSRLTREAGVRRLQVGGLSPEHCARWIASAGLDSDAAALAATVHRETNGNPFFVGEIVHLLARGERLDGVPASVREVIGRRLDRLGPACRETLAVAAVAGETIDPAVLGAVLPEAQVGDHLALAARDRILLAGGRQFAHALIRRALIDETAPSVRADWHGRIAAALERQAGCSAVVTTELVRHLAAAGGAASLRKAFDHACRGAEQAARGLGWEEAVRLYQVALDVGRRAGLLDHARTIELQLALARAWRAAGDVPAARACCDEIVAHCRRQPDPTAKARAALIYAGWLPEWGRVEPAVRAVLEEACRDGALLDDALRARLYARLAGDMVAANEVSQGPRVFALCEEAAAAARRAGDRGALAAALTGTYYASALLGVPAASVPSTQEILDAAEAGGDREYATAIRYARAVTLLAIGEPEAFAAEVDGLATIAAASRMPDALWLAEALGAMRATVEGRFDDAHDAIERAYAFGRRAQLPNAEFVHTSQRIMWHAFQGRLEAVGPEIDAFVATHAIGAGWRPFRALARLAAGDVVAARAELRDLLATGLAPAERGVMARAYLAGLAALCVALGDREQAPALYERIARRRDAWCVDGCHTLGPWALLLGSLARLCDRPADAERHFMEAIRLGRRMGSPPIVARAQSLLADVRWSRRGGEERRDAVALLAEAEPTARACDLSDVVSRIERLRAPVEACAATNVFRHEVDVWTVEYAGHRVRLKDGKGPRYLASLLSAPGRELHVLQLGGAPASPARVGRDDGLRVGAPMTLDDAPDAQARREYRARIAELRAEIDEAEANADLGRTERLRLELEQLVRQVTRCFGGRARRTGAAETARKAVTKVLRTQIGKLLDAHPALGRHLRDSIRMGTVCVYAPAAPVAWDVGIAPEARVA